MSTKKIILFDSWTKGSGHIFRLLDEIEKRSIEIILVHVGSWGDEIGRPIKENIDGLDVIDIQYYGSLKKVIQVENPDLVFFLSLDVITHRAFNRYCKYFNVPTVNLYHGVHSVFQTLDSDSRSLFSLWKNIMMRSYYLTRYSLSNYIFSLTETNATVDIWVELFIDMIRKLSGKAVIEARNDSITDYICVLNKFDKQHAKEKYRMSESKISIVGNPDILKFEGLQDEISAFTEIDNSSKEYITYIGSGVRSTNMMLANDKDYYDHLMNVHDITTRANKKLVLKLHYSRIEKMKCMFEGNKIPVIFSDDSNYVKYLKDSCCSISEPSTAALVPAFMGIPLFLAQFGLLSKVRYGSALTSYPRSVKLKRLESLNNMINNYVMPINNIETKEWISSSTEPLPLEKMPSRVVDIFEKAIRNSENEK